MRRLFSLWMATALTAVTVTKAEDQNSDPAAHTVIVPYAPGAKLDAAQAQRFYVDYADFQRLWERAKVSRLPSLTEADVKGPAEALVKGILYDARIGKGGLEVTARMEVLTRGEPWAKLTWLKKASAAQMGQQQQSVVGAEIEVVTLPADLTVDGQAAVVSDDGTSILIEKAGDHVVEWRFEVPLNTGWKEVKLLLPEVKAGAGLMRVSAGNGEGAPRLTVADLATAVGAVERTEVGFSVSRALGASQRVTVSRQSLGKLMESGTLPAQAMVESALSVFAGTERVTAEIDFDFVGTERRQVVAELDADLYVESVSMTPVGLATLRKENGRQWLQVDYAMPVADRAKVVIGTARVRPVLGERTVPKIIGVATRNSGRWRVMAASNRAVKMMASGGIERVEDNRAGTTDVGTFRWRDDQLLKYVVALPREDSKASLEVVYQLSGQKAEMIAAVSLWRGAGLTEAVSFEMPGGFEVQAVTGTQVKSWHRREDRLEVLLSGAKLTEARLVVHVAKTATMATQRWELEPLLPKGFAKVETLAIVAAHVADEVKLELPPKQTGANSGAGINELNVASLNSIVEVVEPLVVKHALEVKEAKWSATAVLTRLPVKFTADAVLLAQAGEQGLKLTQQVGVEVEQGALPMVTLRLPEALPEALVSGAGVRDVQTRVEAGERLYEVRFQSEVLRQADFEMSLELPLDEKVQLPVVKVDGARQWRGFLAVDNGGTREMNLETGGAVATSVEALSFVPEGLLGPQYFRLAQGNSPSLKFQRLENTAANAAIITLAEVTTALRSNGDRWETVVYSILNRSLQFLPVKLPSNAELVEVSVGGQPVRADRSSDEKQQGVYLVPLIQMRAGESSQQVRLVYRVAGGGKGKLEKRLQLDDPQLLGLSVERTLWNVWVPPDYETRRFDGNMDEIGAEGRELERQQSLLSEVARFNRVMQSKESGSSDKVLALANGERLLRELMGGSEAAAKSAYEGRTQKEEAKTLAGKQVEGKVDKLRQDVANQWNVQNTILTENRVEVGKDLQQIQIQAAQIDGMDDATNSGRLMMRRRGGEKAFAVEEKSKLEAHLDVNDNTRLKGSFFVQPESASGDLLKKGASSKPQAEQQGQKFGIGSNARATGDVMMEGKTEADQQNQRATEVAAKLRMAYSYENLGDFASAERSLREVLRLDANNSAAKRGLEQIELKRQNYSDTARDQRRSAMLNDVNRAWEEPVPNAAPAPAPPSAALSSQLRFLPPPAITAPAAPAAAAPLVDSFAATAADKPTETVADMAGGFGALAVVANAPAPAQKQMAAGIKPVGRVSLQVEVPLEGEVYHFSKLKDHATLEVELHQPWQPAKRQALWVLLIGVGILIAGRVIKKVKALVRRRANSSGVAVSVS